VRPETVTQKASRQTPQIICGDSEEVPVMAGASIVDPDVISIKDPVVVLVVALAVALVVALASERIQQMNQKTANSSPPKFAVAGGKGGVGKTSVALALVSALENAGYPLTLLDCDVENPNCHLYWNVSDSKSEDVSIDVPLIDQDACTHCGQCADFCQFNALADIKSTLLVFDDLCHGCGGCMKLCPVNAIGIKPNVTGQVISVLNEKTPLVYGLLKIGSTRTTSVIDAVREKASVDHLTLIDAAPGTGCAAVAGVRDVDAVILVTEPTPFGLHDLSLSVSVMRDIGKPFGVVVNRMETGHDSIRDYCKQESIPLLLEIPFSIEIAKASADGKGIVDVLPEFETKFLNVFQQLKGMIS